MRALITGISGFVGGFLARHLLDCGDEVLGCSPDGTWQTDDLEGLPVEVELFAWDLGVADGLKPEARRRIDDFRPTAIYHLAALSVPADCGEAEISPLAMAVNVEGVRRVLELAAGLPSQPRVLVISSSHVYAPVTPAAPRVDELAPLGPSRAYGRTKLLAEAEVRRAVDELGCDAVISRSFAHTGPRQSPRMMLPQWVQQFVARSERPVEVKTCDSQIELSDVRDVVRAYRLLIERGERGGVYNVGSGVARRSGDVLEILRRMADPRREIIETRPGFKQDPIADITRLVSLTGWRPAVPIEQTVADTLAWWQRRAF